MAFVIADRVRESSTTTGTGNFTLGGAITGYQTFDAVLDSGDTTYYTIADQGGSNWEVGIGTFTSPSTLARTTILSSSNGGSVVTFTAGTKDVFISLPASKTNTNDQPNVISVNSTSNALRITQTGTGNALLVEDSANPDSSPFVVDASGNVGIGTSSPGQKLDVSGTSRYTFNVANAYTLQTSINAAGSAFADDYKNALSHIWQTSGTERMRIDSSGNLGIGTSAPGVKLDVNGVIRSTGTSAILSVSKRSTGTGDAWGMYSQSGELNFYDYIAAVSRMVIDTSGNVGIGTTTLGSKLTVNGDVAGTFFVNPTTVSANYTIPTNYNAMTAGPITVASGAVVTVPSGSVWTVV